ncbi:putative 60S ribosomal protein L28 [Hypsibius exemplaris]|uniref:Large ribosomal subunit protein eL28 n=1 Tax=Hypsibius exemplaris TaxID=2072580 RepID=A0A9X6NHS2_HYPEX|nr:putative 60S ribosomal protein L28 [Hypsibius exemplaris]
MSAELVWQIMGNNHAFLFKQRGIRKTFSKEPGNLKGFNSPRLSGLANKTVVGVQEAADKKGIVLAISHPTGSRKIKKTNSQVLLKKNSRTVYKSIKNQFRSRHLSNKIRSFAIRKASALLSSQRVKAPDAKAAKVEKAAKSKK